VYVQILPNLTKVLFGSITIQSSFICFNLWASTVLTSLKSDLPTDFTDITLNHRMVWVGRDL